MSIQHVHAYRAKPSLRDVHAVRLETGNIREVSRWVTENGGARAGMTYQETGAVSERHVRIGGLHPDFDVFAYVGDWLTLGDSGVFLALSDQQFHTGFDKVMTVEDIETGAHVE
jgi:hypothetical protein